MSDLGLFIFLFVVPLGVLWAALIIDIIRRDDINLGKKVIWAAFTFITAEFGAVVYILMRPLRYPEDSIAPGAGNPTAENLLLTAEMGDAVSLNAAKEQAYEAADSSI